MFYLQMHLDQISEQLDKKTTKPNEKERSIYSRMEISRIEAKSILASCPLLSFSAKNNV